MILVSDRSYARILAMTSRVERGELTLGLSGMINKLGVLGRRLAIFYKGFFGSFVFSLYCIVLYSIRTVK